MVSYHEYLPKNHVEADRNWSKPNSTSAGAESIEWNVNVTDLDQVQPRVPETYPGTLYPLTDWDRVSSNQRITRNLEILPQRV